MPKKSCRLKRQWIAVRKAKESKKLPPVKMLKALKWKEVFVMCEIGAEQQLVRVKAPPQKRRAVIRVESVETQDYVSGQQGLEELGQEETEELGFVPSAVSEPQWALHMCDKCREESFTFFQLVTIVTEVGGAAHTINLCKQCCNERRQNQSEQPVKAAQWRVDGVRKKAFRGKLWVAFGMKQYLRRMREHLTVKRAWAKAIQADAEKERREGQQGNWQKETPFKDELEVVKRSSDLSFYALSMRG